MSLPTVAKHIASKGRNGDSMLVHMTPAEVNGLAYLAKANGTKLTINPETGLPEAFSLGKVFQAALPIAAGFALGPAGFGLMSAGMAGLAVGGAYTLATGSLEKGLMAGLGAWGGGSLGTPAAGTAGASGTAAATGPAATAVSTPTAASLTSPLTSSAAVTPAAMGVQPTVSGLTAATPGLGSGYGAVNTGIGSIAAPTAGAAPLGTIAGISRIYPTRTCILLCV